MKGGGGGGGYIPTRRKINILDWMRFSFVYKGFNALLARARILLPTNNRKKLIRFVRKHFLFEPRYKIFLQRFAE